MKIWYQTYSPAARADAKWARFEEACERYVPTVARSDTEIKVVGVEMRAPKMVVSSYIQYLHLGQIIENAITAERDGFDAFVLAGMRDIGLNELREAVEIPVVFSGETSYHVACMLAAKFAVIINDEEPLQNATALISRYGLGAHSVPGVHVGYSHTDFIAAFHDDPKRIIEEIKAAARPAIKQGAGIFITGYAAINVFLAEHGIRDIDGVPILDTQAAVIKTAEMMVDLRKLGMPKPRKGPLFAVFKDDIQTARKTYGVQ
jgi:Asp/Glu/hydantoin racemase